MSGPAILALRDGVCLAVREIRAEDAAALQRLVARSSDRSVQLRFFGPLRRLSDGQARRFAEVDGRDRFALVALDPSDPEEIVAVVRYEREPGTDSAEYAALEEDRLQRSEEHTSELQSRQYFVSRLLLEKKRKIGRAH